MPEKVVSSRSLSRLSLLSIIIVLVILAPFGYSIISRVIAVGSGPEELFLERPDPQYDTCVRETAYMRYHHWELLKEVREEVVRYGMRGEISLSGCSNCHTSRERFCNRCHDAASVWPDCYGCHYYPESGRPAAVEEQVAEVKPPGGQASSGTERGLRR
ncbi:MAG: hypothetical protein JSU65_05200 [Candidatus Zixiibacteriota bacterium]|nr:MAG: hypothetical protein JSU65_05200 [candidate division Zixibacteria bacterium]